MFRDESMLVQDGPSCSYYERFDGNCSDSIYKNGMLESGKGVMLHSNLRMWVSGEADNGIIEGTVFDEDEVPIIENSWILSPELERYAKLEEFGEKIEG